MSVQEIRRLPGAFALEHHAPGVPVAVGEDALSVVRAPDGMTVVRPAAAGEWAGLWSGDTAHAPETPGMLVALLAPLAAAGVPVMVASTFAADVVLVPRARLGEAEAALRAAGHAVR